MIPSLVSADEGSDSDSGGETGVGRRHTSLPEAISERCSPCRHLRELAFAEFGRLPDDPAATCLPVAVLVEEPSHSLEGSGRHCERAKPVWLRVGGFEQPLLKPLVVYHQHIALVREVPEEGPFSDPSPGGDTSCGGVPIAVLLEQLERRFLQPLPGLGLPASHTESLRRRRVSD